MDFGTKMSRDIGLLWFSHRNGEILDHGFLRVLRLKQNGGYPHKCDGYIGLTAGSPDTTTDILCRRPLPGTCELHVGLNQPASILVAS